MPSWGARWLAERVEMICRMQTIGHESQLGEDRATDEGFEGYGDRPRMAYLMETMQR